MSPSDTHRYDYIIAGAGSSGLSLAWWISQREELQNRSVLVVDQKMRDQHNKTWCFWSRESHPFENEIRKQWRKAELRIREERLTKPLEEYSYHCIQSNNFRERILTRLENQRQFHLLEAPIENLAGSELEATMTASGTTYSAEYIFQSCFIPTFEQEPDYPLIQHFLGWEVLTDKPVFDADRFTLMDFDPDYAGGIAFIYILPWADDRALLEYTIFSEQLEKPAFYKEKLENYLDKRYGLQIDDYKLIRTEFGDIPMVDRLPPGWYAPRVLNMGTAGGVTKASTGYTFARIQQHSREIATQLAEGQTPEPFTYSSPFYRLYDLWLLQIIHDHPREAVNVFYHLFKNNSLDQVFKFLGEESSPALDLKIMSSVPKKPFLRAIWKTKHRLYS